jgi:hypothetical protein
MASDWLIATVDRRRGPTKTKERSRKRARIPTTERTGFLSPEHGIRLRSPQRGPRPWQGESSLPAARVHSVAFWHAPWLSTDCRNQESCTPTGIQLHQSYIQHIDCHNNLYWLFRQLRAFARPRRATRTDPTPENTLVLRRSTSDSSAREHDPGL